MPWNSTSLDAFERLPSLSFSRCSANVFRLPSASTRGTTKQLSPSGAWASTRNTSTCGAEQNHLCPFSRYSPSLPAGVGGGQVGPDVRAALLLGHPHPGEHPGLLRRGQPAYVVRRSTASCGIHSAASRSSACSAGTAAYVIEIGQPWPGSTWDQR